MALNGFVCSYFRAEARNNVHIIHENRYMDAHLPNALASWLTAGVPGTLSLFEPRFLRLWDAGSGLEM